MTKTYCNDQTKAGELACKKRLFGRYSRYAVAAVHTRSDAVEWFVWDADIVDDVTGKPAVIRQGATKNEVLANLE